MKTRITPRERKLLEKLESEPVNVEFIGQEERTFPNAAPGNDEYMDRDATDQDIKSGNYTKVVKMVYDEIDPS